MKRGQLGAKVFIYAATAVFLILILMFSFRYITGLKERNLQREGTLFTKSVQSAINVQRTQGAGSSAEKTIAVPEGVEAVCFVDHDQTFNKFASAELATNLADYKGFNFFVLPINTFGAETLENFEISNSPICVKAVNGKISLELTSKLGTAIVGPLEDESKHEDCVSAFYTSEPENGIDVVFLGQFYDSSEEFISDVYDYINQVFFKLEPFRSDRNKFNFYMVDDFTDLECSFEGYVMCSSYKTKKLASKCPHEYIFVLVSRNKIKDFVNPIRSSAVSNIANINTADNPMVVMHEFGHSFADLADEYVDSYYLSIPFDGEKYPNCDRNACPKWTGVEETGCFRGCSTNHYYRPTQSSLMRSLSDEYYGPVNEEAIIKLLERYER